MEADEEAGDLCAGTSSRVAEEVKAENEVYQPFGKGGRTDSRYFHHCGK